MIFPNFLKYKKHFQNNNKTVQTNISPLNRVIRQLIILGFGVLPVTCSFILKKLKIHLNYSTHGDCGTKIAVPVKLNRLPTTPLFCKHDSRLFTQKQKNTRQQYFLVACK